MRCDKCGRGVIRNAKNKTWSHVRAPGVKFDHPVRKVIPLGPRK